MRHDRYEVWSYSNRWKAWIRDIYPNKGAAIVRYKSLLQLGEIARPPRHANLPLPLKYRAEFALCKLLKRPSLAHISKTWHRTPSQQIQAKH